jgi:hypothetical protein
MMSVCLPVLNKLERFDTTHQSLCQGSLGAGEEQQELRV